MSTFRRYLLQHHVAFLALIIAMGGTSYAAVTLPKNSVGAKQIKTDAVRAAEIKLGAVASPEVKDGSLTAADLAPGTIPSIPSSLPPNGPAGGDLTGSTYPDPELAADSVGSAEIADGSVGPSELLAPDPWHAVGTVGEPAFTNSWTNAGIGANPLDAAFTIDNDGVVHIRGQIKSGTVSPSTGFAFTLPVGYRPTGNRYFPILTTDGNNVITPGWLAATPSGGVLIGVGNNAFVSIDVSFRP